MWHGNVFNPHQNEEGEWVEDEEQTLRLKANYVISAFGSGLSDEAGTCIHCPLRTKAALALALAPSPSPSSSRVDLFFPV